MSRSRRHQARGFPESRPQHNSPHFTLRLEALDVGPELACKLARDCERILRERAPAGIVVAGLEFHGSKISREAWSFSRSVFAALRAVGERDRRMRLTAQLERAAEVVGEEIDLL